MEKKQSKIGSLPNNFIELKNNGNNLSDENNKNTNTKFNSDQCKSDISIYPNYTDLNCLPYYVICRRRVHKTRKQMVRQFNREILHMAMMQTYALASVRIDRNFSIGFSKEALNLPDFATKDERLRINKIMSNNNR
ncbi:hypothetical protein PV327_006919 [Microctonus hyperodae]|uniref:Uncharacterized protein n=1 Tax=Microctonus hyperodae TaxID=165561 RepID=A0AA39F597_MICHY|nr:hypothetical protein PV327_006919 [Microctonus hyperodae]